MFDLEGVEAKLDRARASLRNLDSEISHYCNGRIDEVRQEAPHLGHRVAFLMGGPANLPIEWAVSIGEIAYNLRSSLDHLIWQLVVHNGETPTTSIQFPIFPDKAKYNRALKRQLKGVDTPSRKMIEEVQPYQESSETGLFLRVLHSICNIDKHRHLNLVDHYSSMSAHLKEDVKRELLPEGLSGGVSLYLYLEGTGEEHKVELDVDLQVCFMDRDIWETGVRYQSTVEGSQLPYPPVISTLSDCVTAVDNIVSQLSQERSPLPTSFGMPRQNLV